MLHTPGKFFSRKKNLTFHADRYQWRQFARNVKISGEHKKNITKLLSAELAKSGKGYLPLQKWPKPPIEAFLLKNVFMDK